MLQNAWRWCRTVQSPDRGSCNATYLSVMIQNKLFVVAGDLIREKQKQIHQAGCWATIADERMNLQKWEQLVIVICYPSRRRRHKKAAGGPPGNDDCEPHSEVKLSRAAIGDTILQQISKHDRYLSQCVAQCQHSGKRACWHGCTDSSAGRASIGWTWARCKQWKLQPSAVIHEWVSSFLTAHQHIKGHSVP